MDDLLHHAHRAAEPGNNIALNSKLVRVEYYNLAGQRLARPVGICIQKNIYEGGKTIVKKIF